MQLSKNQQNIRIWVCVDLVLGKRIELLPEQAHYLNNVMRCEKDCSIKCFNNNSGEFWCKLIELSKNKAVIEPFEKIRDCENESDIWVLFSPLKKDKTDFVIEKAVELGANRIVPVLTERTNVKHIKIERYTAQAIEAAEQCERLSVPEIGKPINLRELLNKWDEKRVVYFADERRKGENAVDVFNKTLNCPSAILIGPEGGFSDSEANFINQHKFVKNINLGKRILRAETAVCATLAVWQATVGDWK